MTEENAIRETRIDGIVGTLKQRNAKSVTDASIWQKFISKKNYQHVWNRAKSVELSYYYYYCPLWISFQDKPIHRSPIHFVNKSQILLCDRVL